MHFLLPNQGALVILQDSVQVLSKSGLDGRPEHNCRLVGNLPRSSVQLDTNMLTGLLYTCVHLPLHNYGCTHQEKLTSSSPFFSTSEAGTAVLGDSQYKVEHGNIQYMDKCCQDKCCLDKCHCDSWHLLKMVPGTYF